MSEIRTELARGQRKNGQPQERFVLPQWALDIIRPLGRKLCRVLWRISYKGVENIPQTGGLIIAANHQTYIDPFWVGFQVQRAQRFLAWNEAFDWPVVGRLMGFFGAWPLDVEKTDPAAIRRSLQWLKEGGVIVIFPEGGRGNPDGSMIRFKPGAVRMAIEAGVPILPVTIRGAHHVWPKSSSFPSFAKVEVIYHPIFHIEPQEGEDTRQCARRETERLASIIKSAL